MCNQVHKGNKCSNSEFVLKCVIQMDGFYAIEINKWPNSFLSVWTHQRNCSLHVDTLDMLFVHCLVFLAGG